MFALRNGPVHMEPHYPHDPGYGPPPEESPLLDHPMYPHSAYHTPTHEYDGYGFHHYSRPPPHAGIEPGTSMPWPSMIAGQPPSYMPGMVQAHAGVMQPMPASAPPQLSGGLSRPGAHHTPRKTLTDDQRREICLYAQDHPQAKQTEIAEVFSVERSTISKVLRKKHEYLTPPEEVKPVPKRPKAKLPDIDRAVGNWLRNFEKYGRKATDSAIREKALEFAAISGSEKDKVVNHINSSSWLEQFKHKYLAVSPRSRKASLRHERSRGLLPKIDRAHTSDGLPTAAGARELSTSASHESLQMVTGSDLDRRPEHSHSNPALSSSFSESPMSPYHTDAMQESSSLYTSDPSATLTASPFLSQSSQAQAGIAIPANASSFRPRSRTTPALSTANYMSPPQSSEDQTPKLIPASSSTYDSPGPVPPPDPHSRVPHYATAASVARRASSTTDGNLSASYSPAMPPPPLSTSIQSSPVILPPSHSLHHSSPISAGTSVGGLSNLSPATSHYQFGPSSIPGVAQVSSPPTQDDARAALRLIMDFIQTQPSGIADSQDYFLIDKMLQRLSLPPPQILHESHPLQSQPHMAPQQGHETQNAMHNQHMPGHHAPHPQQQPRAPPNPSTHGHMPS